MRVAVSTPAGNVGRVVAARLLDAGAEVVAIHRDTGKLEDLAARGADLRQGSLSDEMFLASATAGVDALFWVTPMDPKAANLRAAQNELGVAAAAAVRANGIGRVVNVSSLGAQHDEGTGPVAGLHDVEEMLDSSGATVLHLRPAYFFENYRVQVQAIKMMGAIMLPVSADTTIPMIAARDVGEVAADKLLEDSWPAAILELHGPAEISFAEAAATISEAIGRQVPHMEVDALQARMGLSMLGMSPSVIDAVLELYAAIESGHLRSLEPRSAQTTTPTTLAEWAAETLAAAFA